MAGTNKPGDTGRGSKRSGVERSNARSTQSNGSNKKNPKSLQQEIAEAVVATKEQQNQVVWFLEDWHERQMQKQAREQKEADRLELAKKQDAVRKRQAEAGKKMELQVKEKPARVQERKRQIAHDLDDAEKEHQKQAAAAKQQQQEEQEADRLELAKKQDAARKRQAEAGKKVELQVKEKAANLRKIPLETIAEGVEEVARYSNGRLDKTTAQLPTMTPANRVPQRRHPTNAAGGNRPLKRAGPASNQLPTAKAPRLVSGQQNKSLAAMATGQSVPKTAETNSAQPKLPPKRSKAPLVRVIGKFAGGERHVQIQAHARIEYRLQTENGTTTSGSQETKQYFIEKAQIGNECEVRLRTIDGKHFCILPFVSLWTSCVCSEFEQQPGDDSPGAMVHISFNNDHTFQYNQVRIRIPKPCQHGMEKWTFAKAFLNIFENRG